MTELHLEASLLALNDAGLRPSDVDGIVPSSVAERVVEDFTRNLGIKDLGFSSTPHAGGSSYVMGIQEACMAVNAGVADCVLLPAGRLGYSSMQRASRVAEHPNPALTDMVEFEFPLGNVGPAMWFAQQARRHMHLYGTTSEQLGRMAVTIRGHANLNPQALMYARTLTLEDHQASRMIVDPFRLFDCSLETDGAGAIVVTSADRAKDLRQPPVLISGVGSAYGYPGTSVTQAEEPSELRGIGHAGRRAFAMAGMGPQDIDVVAVHEGFSFFVIACLEALGFCSVGEGGPLVASEDIALGGRLPLNTHGGALSEAHVSGANHVIEIVRQLRRSVEQPRQVEGCQIGLVANEGNFDNGAVVILKKP